MIKNIIFDLGGVILTIDHNQAIQRFKEIGLDDAEEWLDPYTQRGIFGDVEAGRIDAEEFRVKFSEIVGREVSFEQCKYAWQGYLKDLPQRNLTALQQLKKDGYKLILLSNTNPFMMDWVESEEFDGHGNPVSSYFDNCYKSYQVKMMKPDKAFFQLVLNNENILPEETLFIDDGVRNVAAASEFGIKTFCPENGEDWTNEIYKHLNK